MIVETVLITVVATIILQVFKEEVTNLGNYIRNNKFQTFVVIALLAIIVMLYKGTFL